ncbi:Methionyl-tRNA formyltransferase [subsurface metagenome]
MNIVIFTTPTKHHIYFVNKVYKEFNISSVIYERRTLLKKYSTGPFYDNEQDKYEELFFDKASGGVERTYPKELDRKVITIYGVNQQGLDAYLNALAPDVVVVYGTGIIYRHLVNLPKRGMINLHGGLTQFYRGLDSTLWAFYHKDFENIGITIHYVEPELDAGDILSQRRISVEKTDEIYHFRYKITKQATEMTLNLLKKFSKHRDRLEAVPTQPKGRYFSAMDLQRKFIALKNLKEYQKRL